MTPTPSTDNPLELLAWQLLRINYRQVTAEDKSVYPRQDWLQLQGELENLALTVQQAAVMCRVLAENAE